MTAGPAAPAAGNSRSADGRAGGRGGMARSTIKLGSWNCPPVSSEAAAAVAPACAVMGTTADKRRRGMAAIIGTGGDGGAGGIITGMGSGTAGSGGHGAWPAG